MKLRLILVGILIFLPVFLFAQPGDPGVDPDVPITGIEFLLGGGALLGVRKILNHIKSHKRQ